MKKTIIEDPSHPAHSIQADGRDPDFDLYAWTRDCWANRWKISAAIIVAVIAVSALNLAKPTKHKSTASILLTKSAGDYFTENTAAFFWPHQDPLGQLANRYKINVKTDQVSVQPSVSQNADGLKTLTIEVTASKPKTARRMAAGLAELFVKKADTLDPGVEKIAEIKKSHARVFETLALQERVLEREKKYLTSEYRSLKKTISHLRTDALSFVVLNNQLNFLSWRSSEIDLKLLENDIAQAGQEYALKQQLLPEGKTKLLALSATETLRPKLVVTDAVFAGLAALLAAIIVIFVRRNRVGRQSRS